MNESLKQYARELFTGMVRESGMPVTDAGMRDEWEALNAEQGSLIRNDSDFSPFWRLVTAIVTRPARWLVTLLIEHVLPNSFLRFASGVYLDVYAWAVHLERKPSAAARGRIRFTRAGSMGDAAIPLGAAIETPPINDRVYRVLTVEAAIIANGETFADVPVEAEAAGAAYNLTAHAVSGAGEERRETLIAEVEGRIRCAFRQNSAYEVTKTLPLSRFSFSRLSDELHDALPDLLSVEFHRGEDIVSAISLPRLDSLEIEMGA